MSKQEKIVRNRKNTLAVMVILVVLASIFVFSTKTNATESREVYKYYTSYEVQPGDSLWTIADNYLVPEYNDKEAYINEIKKLNHLLDDDITSGKHIVLCYYSYEIL